MIPPPPGVTIPRHPDFLRAPAVMNILRLLRPMASPVAALSIAGLLGAADAPAVDAGANALKLGVSDGPPRKLHFAVAGQTVIETPADGLWSVAGAWQNGWPDNWVHAHPDTITTAGEWTVVSGKLAMPGGVMDVQDSYRHENGLVRGIRRWAWRGKETLPRCTLAIRWSIPGAAQAKVMLPGVVVHGNPAGEKTGNHAVIVHRGNPGDRTFVEEHRLAAPWVSIEWPNENSTRAVAMHTVPCPAPAANQNDQWWTLGLTSLAGATELATLSGPVAANHRNAVVKALQGKFLDYPDTWLNLAPGTVIEKSFLLEVVPSTTKGSGFRQPMRTAMRMFPCGDTSGLPSYREILRSKYQFALGRFRDLPGAPGFEMYPDHVAGTKYVMGWCGQADTASYAMLGLARTLKDPRMPDIGRRTLDLLAQAPFNDHGFLLIHDAESGKWSGQDPVSQGQAMEGFARAITAARDLGNIPTTTWEDFLRKACTLHAARILRADWSPINTAEAFFIAPLCHGHRLFGDPSYKQAALKAAEYYAKRHIPMDEPYWGGTLDARCEDKEGAWAAFQGFLAVYELTNDSQYLGWAEHAMDVALSYTVLWDIDLPAGRLRDHALKTRGWTIVSAQNQHLDVFGVVYTPEIWRMGTYLGRPDLHRLAAVMFRSCGQMIDPLGSQGEQIQHTNFAQHGDMSNVFRLRGGYSESWTVFWITAHFLNAAAEFERMGVDLDTHK